MSSSLASYGRYSQQRGAYSAAMKTGTMAAGLAAASPIFSFRHAPGEGSNIKALVDMVSVSIASLGTGFAAGVGYVDMVAARAFTVSDTGGWITPTYTSATGSGTGGTIPAGTYYFAITAIGPWGESAKSTERNVVLTGATSSVAHVIAAYAGATGYRIYVGAATGVYTSYFEDADGTYTQTAAAGTAGSPPAAATPGSAIVLTGNNGKRKTTDASSSASGVIANTLTLTAGTRTLDSQPLAAVQFTVSTETTKTHLDHLNLWHSGEDGSPLILGNDEGFVVRATVPATGIWQAVIEIDWREVA